MNYYQHHIGDFIRDTARLSDAQSMAYLRMMWMYYEKESPIENDPDAVAFIIGANASDVHQIFKHFFFLHEGFWHHSRCDKEILAFRKKSEKAKNSANARWENANAMRTHEKNRKTDANQEPITNIKAKEYKPPVDDGGASFGEKQNSTNSPVDQQADSVGGHGSAGGLPPADQQDPDQQACMRVGDQAGENQNGQQAGLPVGGHGDCPVQRIVDLYHEVLPELPRVKVMTERRKTQIRQRWREHRSMQTLDRWSAFFMYVRESDFLMGRVDSADRKTFVADLEFLTTQSKFVKIIEGKYHDNRA